jgi:1-pyrroline-5-carboxylate dehydrogenase
MNKTPYNIPKPENEPIKSYAPGSQEKTSLKAKITQLKSTQIEIPVIIGGKKKPETPAHVSFPIIISMF